MQVKNGIFIFLSGKEKMHKKWFLIFSRGKDGEHLFEWITPQSLYIWEFLRSVHSKDLDSIHRVPIYRATQLTLSGKIDLNSESPLPEKKKIFIHFQKHFLTKTETHDRKNDAILVYKKPGFQSFYESMDLSLRERGVSDGGSYSDQSPYHCSYYPHGTVSENPEHTV